MLTLHIDMSKVYPKLKIALDVYGQEVQRRALYNTLNYACNPLQTIVRRHVAKQTSAKYGRVAAHIKAKQAHPNRLQWRLEARDIAMKLSEFKGTLTPGRQNPRITVWGKSKQFKGAFVMSFGGQVQVVKRTSPHAHGPGRGPAGVKVLYGPIIPKEMIREGFPSRHELERAIPDRVLKRLPHELEQAVIRAKAASGT